MVASEYPHHSPSRRRALYRTWSPAASRGLCYSTNSASNRLKVCTCACQHWISEQNVTPCCLCTTLHHVQRCLMRACRKLAHAEQLGQTIRAAEMSSPSIARRNRYYPQRLANAEIVPPRGNQPAGQTLMLAPAISLIIAC